MEEKSNIFCMEERLLQITSQDHLSEINKRITELLPDSINTDWIKNHAGKDLTPLGGELIYSLQMPARELLLTGGKRWRPLLLVLCAQLAAIENQFDKETCKEILSNSYLLAPLVELTHNGSLMIDDIEDKSETRRGIPAAYITYGEDVAINAGNWLYFFPTLLIEKIALSSEQKASLYEIFCRSMRRMHWGQGIDISWHQKPNFYPTPQDYFIMCRLKTGSLSAMAMELGYQLGCKEKTDSKGSLLTQIAEEIGVAFQIFDDITNLRKGNPGKMRGDDFIEGKKSYPLILFAQKGDCLFLSQKIQKIQKKGILKAQKEIAQLVTLLEESGCINEAEQEANRLLEKALSKLQIFQPSPIRHQIQNIIERFSVK